MLEKLIDPISNILDKFVADKDLKQKLEHELKTELHRANMAQIEVNKEEAKHRTLFVSGARRPFTGWVCCNCFSLSFYFRTYTYLVYCIISITSLPQFDMGSLLDSYIISI